MDDVHDRKLELLTAVMHELIRAGTLTEEMLERVARRFDGKAHEYRGSDREERYEDLATAARILPFEASAPTAADARAEYQRRQIRERTERLARKAPDAP